MTIDHRVLWNFLAPLLLSVIFTLYLAPTKYISGDIIAISMLTYLIVTQRFRWQQLLKGLKELAPLAVLALYAFVFFLLERGSNNLQYLLELLSGFVPFLLLYALIRADKHFQTGYLLPCTFILSGLVHLGYMYYDIWQAFRDTDIAIPTLSDLRALESIKDAPRVGRRYLSMALVHLLCGGTLLGIVAQEKLLRITGYGITFLAIFSLALIDARSAYFSMVGGLVVFFLIFRETHLIPAVKQILACRFQLKLGIVIVLVIIASVAYSSGKSRWSVMMYSVEAAYIDVTKDGGKGQRPYVDNYFWTKPVIDEKTCFAERHFRCSVDQSAYLRTAWLLEGLISPLYEPWGIGYSHDYMARRWNVAGDSDKFQRIDSSMTQQIVTYGFIGLLLYCVFATQIVTSALSISNSKKSTAIFALALLLLILTYFVRGTFDLISEGAWRYLMAITGMYYGLLHSAQGKREISDGDLFNR